MNPNCKFQETDKSRLGFWIEWWMGESYDYSVKIQRRRHWWNTAFTKSSFCQCVLFFPWDRAICLLCSSLSLVCILLLYLCFLSLKLCDTLGNVLGLWRVLHRLQWGFTDREKRERVIRKLGAEKGRWCMDVDKTRTPTISALFIYFFSYLLVVLFG